MEFFQKLGSLVEERWKYRDYDEEIFPSIAAEALNETDPSKWVNPWDIVRWVNTTGQLPAQQDIPAAFGDPPITLFSGPRFHIDIYYWVDGTTSIHQHGFCGAFQVLLGSSIHSHYCFTPRRVINQNLMVGDISLETVDLLEKGAIKRILPGDEYIHSLFHLDRPSATICVRTYQTYRGVPQYNYHKPCFADNPFFTEPLQAKQTQCASLLFTIQHPETDEIIAELLAHSDFQTTISILDLARNNLLGNQLEKAFGLSIGEQRFQALMEIARRRHGELVDLIEPVFDESIRQRNLSLRRAQITSNEHRFFLALLLNIPDRQKLLDLVKQRYPEQDPVATVTDWVEELANTKLAGSHEPNVLGIENFDEDYLFVFQSLLEGQTTEQVRAAFERERSSEELKALGNKPDELCDTIRNSILFKTIFLDEKPAMTAAQQASISSKH